MDYLDAKNKALKGDQLHALLKALNISPEICYRLDQ